MYVKAILTTFILASSAFGLAPPSHFHKRDSLHHHRHAHAQLGVPRSPSPLFGSTEPVRSQRRHTRTKRCQKRPHPQPAPADPIHVETASPPAQSQPPPVTPPPTTQPEQPPNPQPEPPANPQPEPPANPQPEPPANPQPEQPANPQPPSDGGGGGGRQMTGDGTFYDAGLGACGIVNSNTDFIAAVSHQVFDGYGGYWGSNPNNNPICGKVITATFEGKSVTVTITDRCGGCNGPTDVDFTPTAFSQLGHMDRGRLKGIQWTLPDP